jgi:hypothetical protein
MTIFSAELGRQIQNYKKDGELFFFWKNNTVFSLFLVGRLPLGDEFLRKFIVYCCSTV